MANLVERLFPGLALRRTLKLVALERSKRAYDAAKTSPHHRRPTSLDSPDATMTGAGDKLRAWARDLDENHDLAIGILDTLVNNIVGPGVTIEPAVTRKNGNPVENVNTQIRDLWTEWTRAPEVTGELPFGEVQRLMCRAWLRDGEGLAQHVRGTNPRIRYPTRVPYSLELIEADFLPFDYNDDSRGIVHGVQKDQWGRPVGYFLYKSHPGNSITGLMIGGRDTKRVDADNLLHVKFTRRFRQTRGVSIFHGIAHRLDDLKDYEEAERIAARVSAAFTGYIKKSADNAVTASDLTDDGDRSFEMSPGMVFENLLPGEEIGTIASNRPNPNLENFRNAMLRAAAAGTGTGYSSISRDFGGTYSSQRQELVESMPAYKRMRDYFVERFLRPVYREFINANIDAGLLRVPANVDPYAVEFIGAGMPWIDPKKEIEADALAVENGFKSRTQVIRERGGDPRLVDQQNEADTFEKAEPAPMAAPEPEPAAENDDESEVA